MSRSAGSEATPALSESALTKSLLVLTREAGVDLTARQAELMVRHIMLMLQWNRTTNLTRITDAHEILSRHILDALIPARWLPRMGRALDVGSGAGFPGLTLKVFLPDLQMSLVESNRKKASFLRVVQSQLNLDDLEVLPWRWEDLSRAVREGRGPRWDLITMRAVRLEQEHLTDLAGQLLKKGGTFGFWAGAQGPETAANFERTALKAGLSLQGCRGYRIPTLDRLRYLLLWKRLD